MSVLAIDPARPGADASVAAVAFGGVFKFRLRATVRVPTASGRVPARIVARTERIDGPPLYEVETLGHVRTGMTVAEALIELA